MAEHTFAGACPDDTQPDALDPNCPACELIGETARLEAEIDRLRHALRMLADPDEPPYPDWSFFGIAEDRENAMHKYAAEALASEREQA